MVDFSAARAAGWFVREGVFQGTSDDCLGRWYVGRRDLPYRPYGRGFATVAEAWRAAASLQGELDDEASS